MKHSVLLLLLLLQTSSAHSQTDSFSVYYHTGISTLSEAQKQRLDSLLYDSHLHGQSLIYIRAYADEPGTNTLNNTLASSRAKTVADYLITSGINPAQLAQVAGFGNKVHTGSDYHQRRADILITHSATPIPIAASVQEKKDTLPPRPRSLRDLKTMKPGEMMVIENLQFKVSTDSFEKVSFPILKELADVLHDFPGVSIRLEGHICCGSKADSSKWLTLGYELSLSRARAVLKYLTRHGISYTRLSCAGFGFSRPKVYPEQTQEDMYLNRRVEIRVVSNK